MKRLLPSVAGRPARTLLVLALGALVMGCDALAGEDPANGGPGTSSEGGVDGTAGPGQPGQPGGDGGSDDGRIPEGAPPGDADTSTCTTTFRFVPAAGAGVKTVAVTGEWNN